MAESRNIKDLLQWLKDYLSMSKRNGITSQKMEVAIKRYRAYAQEMRNKNPEKLQINYNDKTTNAGAYFERIRMHMKKTFTCSLIPDGGTSYHNIEGIGLSFPTYSNWQDGLGKHSNFLINYDPEQDKGRSLLFDTLVMNMLLTFPAGKIHFNFVDLNGTGAAIQFTGKNKLDKQFYKYISTPQEWQNLCKRLQDNLSTAVEDYGNIEDYNQENSIIVSPYEVVCLLDYPNGLPSYSYNEQIGSLVKNGFRAGIYFVVLKNINYKKQNEHEIDITETGNFNVVRDEHEGSLVEKNILHHVPLVSIGAWRQKCFEFLNEELKNQNSIQKDWEAMINAPYSELYSDIDVPVGFTADTQPFHFKLKVENSNYHGFILGGTGSGKTTFMHDIILSLILTYSPEDLELHLLDFKGTEFSCYREIKHIKSLLVQGPDDIIVAQVINEIWQEYERRREIMKKEGNNDIVRYNHCHSNCRMKQIILLIDECQDLFPKTTSPSKNLLNAQKVLAEIAQKGRSYGIHLLLATQSFDNGSFDDSLRNQISDVYLLKNTKKSDYQKFNTIVDERKMQNALTEMYNKVGMCYFSTNDEMFHVDNVAKDRDSSNRYKIPYQKDLIEAAIKKSSSCESNGQYYFEGGQVFNLSAKELKCIEKLACKEDCIIASPGVKVSYKVPPLVIPLKRDSLENIVVMGINEEAGKKHVATQTTMNLFLSLMIQNQQKELGYKFMVYDCLCDKDAKYYQLLHNLQLNNYCNLINTNNLLDLCNEIHNGHSHPTIVVIIGQEKMIDLKKNISFNDDMDNKSKIKDSVEDLIGSRINAKQGGMIAAAAIKVGLSEKNKSGGNIRNMKEAIQYLLTEGPSFDIHTIFQVDRPSNFLFGDETETRRKGIYKYFHHGIFLRLEDHEGNRLSLKGSVELPKLKNLRAYYYDLSNDSDNLIAPYQLPEYQDVINLINSK